MGHRGRITKRAVDALQGPRGGSAEVLWDTEIPGFGCRARRGLKVYFVRYGVGRGRKRWLTIGRHGAPFVDRNTGHGTTLTADLARAEARRLLGLRAIGRDPAEARDTARAVPTLSEFWPRYVREHAEPYKGESTVAEDRRLFAKKLEPALGRLQLDKIGPGAATKLHVSLKSTPTTANRCLSLLSNVITIARRWQVLPPGHVNPCEDVPRYPERKRERFLDGDELARVGAALTAAAETSGVWMVAALRVFALTGARPKEILELRRDQLATLSLGYVKQKGKRRGQERERVIYLPPSIVQLLDELPALHGNPWVFASTRRKGEHVGHGGLYALWKRVRTAAELPKEVRLYDLRHTFASVGLAQGLSLEFIGGLMDHRKPSTTKRYAHLGAHPLRVAGDETAAAIEEAMKGKPS